MLASKQTTLKPLLESKDGVHLTAYLVNRGDLIDLKSQVRTSIGEAGEWLSHVMTIDELKKFLEPLDALLNDSRIFKQMKGNIGLFRNKDSFRVLNIPVDVEQSCQVATSFHVKPLLRWLQGDEEFLMLGLDKNSASLYLGSQTSLKLIDSILFPEGFKATESGYMSLNDARKRKAKETETFIWLNDWISDLTKVSKPKLFVAGKPSLVNSLHPFDMDHEDDCILDDLAQMVLRQGGEVIVAKREEIPKGRPILAILDGDGAELKKTEDLHYEVLQEEGR